MAGQLYEVMGQVKWAPLECCPEELRGTIVHLKSKEGELFEVDAEVACMSGRIRSLLMKGEEQTKEFISFPLKSHVVSKVIEYCKHHREHPPHEIRTPLESDNLQACGASRWDAAFVTVDKDTLFELMVAGSCMEIPSLFMLTSAKVAITTGRKSSRKLRMDFKMSNDLSAREEAELRREYNASVAHHDPKTKPDFAASTAVMSGMSLASENNNMSQEDVLTGFAVSAKSWKQACWRALAMQDWHHLANAPPDVRNDRELIKAAIMASSGAALKYASPELREDQKLVLEAVKCFGSVFREASTELRNDREFVLEAVTAHSLALAGASDNHRGDPDLLREAARRGRGSALQGASMQLRNDRDFVLELVTWDPEAFLGATAEMQGDREFCLAAAKRNGGSLKHMASKYQADREIVNAAVKDTTQAVHYAHSSRRAEMMKPAWDIMMDPLSEQEEEEMSTIQVAATAGPRQTGLVVNTREGKTMPYTAMQLQKSVQFSALSTMSANVGQANYVAANSYLDKLPGFQRPHIDAVTLMWGAVGGIGMRWKAFASQDFLNKTPEALMSIQDCCKVLHITCARAETPEWYAMSFFDEWTRQYMLQKTANVNTGVSEGWKPGEDAPGRWIEEAKERERNPDVYGRGGKQMQKGGGTPSSPLGGWPALARPLEEGARVRLIGLRAKNGLTGVLVQKFADGKWKVKLDDDSGNALLRANYLEMIAVPDKSGGTAQPAPLPPRQQNDIDDDSLGISAADIRRLKIEERRANLKEKIAAKRQVTATSLLRVKNSPAEVVPGVVKRREFLIAGSWDDFQAPRSMLWNDVEGYYTHQVQIGANGWEGFLILLDRSWNAVLHPDVLKEGTAGSSYTLEGPDPRWKCDGQMWVIGKDGGPGSKYEVRIFASTTGHWETLEWVRLSRAISPLENRLKAGSAALREVSTTPPGSTAQDDADSPSASAAES